MKEHPHPGQPANRAYWQKKISITTTWIGIFLLLGGTVLLLGKMHMIIPAWLATWPVLLIGIGLLTGILNGFRHFIWLALMAVGSFFLLQQQMPQWRLEQYTTPLVIILVGFSFLLRRRSHHHGHAHHYHNWWHWDTAGKGEFVDSTVVLGNVRKTVTYKNFTGGDVTGVLGAAVIDLSNADMSGHARMDITLCFGHAQLIVPPHWTIQSEITGFFGGINDKRTVHNIDMGQPPKILVLDGTAFCGSLEISDEKPADRDLL